MRMLFLVKRKIYNIYFVISQLFAQYYFWVSQFFAQNFDFENDFAWAKGKVQTLDHFSISLVPLYPSSPIIESTDRKLFQTLKTLDFSKKHLISLSATRVSSKLLNFYHMYLYIIISYCKEHLKALKTLDFTKDLWLI